MRITAKHASRCTTPAVGIPAEHLPRITERFYRVSTSRSRETGGTGLGLSIVKHVLQLHGGRLEIESEVGVGSTFSGVFGRGSPARAAKHDGSVLNRSAIWLSCEARFSAAQNPLFHK